MAPLRKDVYLVEYLRHRFQIGTEEAIKEWSERFTELLEEGRYDLCHLLIRDAKTGGLPKHVPYGIGIIRYREGSLAELQGDLQKALTAYDASLQTFNSAEIPGLDREQLIAEVLGRLATVQKAKGNYTEARRSYKQQLQLHTQAQTINIRRVIAVLKELVGLAMLQGDYEEAQQYLEDRLKIAQKQGNSGEQVDTLLELAALHQRRGDLDMADQLCETGLSIAKDMEYQVALVNALGQRASIRRDQKRYDDALLLYRAAQDVALEIGDQVKTSEIQEQLTALERDVEEVTRSRNVFISYNYHDRDFVERLVRDLTDRGHKVWWDEWEIKVGDSIIEKISQGINGSAYLSVVLSPHSVKSNWVQRELGSALMRQLSADRDITVLPLLISDCEVPVLLREIKWADFRQDYQAGLKELLGALITKGADG
jgi:tetratricopeptide (TPR) repeat protein